MAYDLTDQSTQVLLAFIREIETGKTGREAYDVLYGHNEIERPFSTLTLDRAIAAGRGWAGAHGSSAAGAYQFMNGTLKDLKATEGLTGEEVLNPLMQDCLALALLNRRGYQDFMAERIGPVEFARKLAQEWASLPVLHETRGAQRILARGESYYAGDGWNRALARPREVEEVLSEVLRLRGRKVAHDGASGDPDTRVAVGIMGGAVLAMGAVWAWLSELPCRILGVFCQ